MATPVWRERAKGRLKLNYVQAVLLGEYIVSVLGLLS